MSGFAYHHAPEWLITVVGRAACRLGQCNVTCRGRRDHLPNDPWAVTFDETKSCAACGGSGRSPIHAVSIGMPNCSACNGTGLALEGMSEASRKAVDAVLEKVLGEAFIVDDWQKPILERITSPTRCPTCGSHAKRLIALKSATVAGCSDEWHRTTLNPGAILRMKSSGAVVVVQSDGSAVTTEGKHYATASWMTSACAGYPQDWFTVVHPGMASS